MMHEAGIDPSGAARFFETLKASESGTELTGALSWVSTHPEHSERIEAIEELIEELGGTRERDLHIDWPAVQESLSQAKEKDAPDEDDRDAPEADSEAQRETTKEDSQ